MAEILPMICKACQKEKTKYGVWVDGICPDCITNQVFAGKIGAECAVARSHYQGCEDCRKTIKK